MDKEEKFILASIEDEAQRCTDENRICFTEFLDMRIQGLAEQTMKYSKSFFYGGYDMAERRIAVFLPDYAEEADFLEDDPLEILRAVHKSGGRELTHRDYLGSLLGLGITRDRIGDILVYPQGADIIIMRSMEEFLLTNYAKAGRTELQLSVVPIEQLNTASVRTVTVTDTVQSVRLDAVLAAAFKSARSKAQDAVREGVVFVNNAQVTKPDRELSEGDKIVLRGSGKCILEEIGGESKKGRTFIRIKRYL